MYDPCRLEKIAQSAWTGLKILTLFADVLVDGSHARVADHIRVVQVEIGIEVYDVGNVVTCDLSEGGNQAAGMMTSAKPLNPGVWMTL